TFEQESPYWKRTRDVKMLNSAKKSSKVAEEVFPSNLALCGVAALGICARSWA
ncbi:hypothetical protein J6590_066397, partial [Homalodisca vitripennis]